MTTHLNQNNAALSQTHNNQEASSDEDECLKAMADLDAFLEEDSRFSPQKSTPPLLHVVAQPPATTSEKDKKRVLGSPPSKAPAGASPFPSYYSFPVHAAPAITSDHEALKRSVSSLAPKISNLHEYFKFRQEWCALHIQINKHGLWAPAFRPWPNLPQKPRDLCADYEHTIQRDRLVIEAYWLHSRQELVNVNPDHAMWTPLFDPAAPFDFDLAERFAQQVWSNQHRTGEVLCLTPFQQCQMFSLRTDRMKKHMASFSKSTRGADNRSIQSPKAVLLTALARWKERQPNLGDIHKLLSRAEARYYLGEEASAKQISQLAGFISGSKSQDAKTVSQSLKRLENWLPSNNAATPSK